MSFSLRCLFGFIFSTGCGTVVLAQESRDDADRSPRRERNRRDRDFDRDSFGNTEDRRSDEAGRPQRRWERGERDSQDGDPRRREWRERRMNRFNRWAEASPEERLEIQADFSVRRLARMYDLTDDQEKSARVEVLKGLREQRSAMGPDAEKMDKAMGEVQRFWRDRVARREAGEDLGDAEDDPRWQILRNQLRDVREKSTVGFGELAERIERTLPKAQAEEGRARRAELMEMWQNGSERWGRDRARRRAESSEAPLAPDSQQQVNLGLLEKYTTEFITKHALEAGQVGASRSILSDVQERYRKVERDQKDARALVPQFKPDEQHRQFDALDQPLRELYDELKLRLDNLLTEKQRRSAQG